jgi:hypothetical protein
VLTDVTSAGHTETLTTLRGAHYEKVRVTEVTPATVAFVLSAGVCRIPIAEFPVETRKRFRYDEAKATAWLAEQSLQAAVAAQPTPRATNRVHDVEYVAALMKAGAIDPHSGRFYLPDPALQQRAAAFEWLQRNGAPPPHAPSFATFPRRSQVNAAAIPGFCRSIYFRTFTSRKPILFWATLCRKRLPPCETSYMSFSRRDIGGFWGLWT